MTNDEWNAVRAGEGDSFAGPMGREILTMLAAP